MDKVITYRINAAPIREAINSRPLTDFVSLEPSKGGLYICPICGSGTGAHRTGALSIRKTDNRVTCFAGQCFGDKGEDTLGALRRIYNGKSEAEIFSLCGYQLDESETQAKEPEQKKKPEEKPRDTPNFKEQIDRFADALPGSEGESYLKGRGFTPETMQRFHLGYDGQRHCVTIPYNPKGSYYSTRSTRPDERAHSNLKGVPMPLFNAAALYSGETCFVVESPLCAISIEQCGLSAVALSGTGGKARLLDQLRKKPTTAALILCLDNDDAGRKAAEDLGPKLEELGMFCVNGTSAVLGDERDSGKESFRKDPNEILQKDGTEALRQAVTETAAETIRQRTMTSQAEEEDRQERMGESSIDSFLEAIQTRKYEPIPTGIRDIDQAIGGGLIRQQVILLGAAPGAGKTALAQWIFETMAEDGRADIMYLNLEMSRDQVLARSISRVAKKNRLNIKPVEVLQGYKWDRDQRATVIAACDLYRRTIARHLAYNPDGLSADLDTILAFMEREAARAEAADKYAPIWVIDYLQIVKGGPREDAVETIKRAMISFKSYAVRHNSIVFVIMANNRDSNKSGDVTMESGRDTSALEYSADLQLGLAFTRCLNRPGQDTKDKKDLTHDEKAFKTLKITKGRFGGEDTEVDLFFNGESMTYTQIAHDLTSTKSTRR